MSNLPKRFPRTALIERAGLLELAINTAQDTTLASLKAVQGRHDTRRYEQFENRMKLLDEARELVNKARVVLWQLT